MIDPDSFETKDSPEKSSSKTNAGNAVVTGFLSHLIELRDRLLKVVLVIAVVFVVLFPFAKDIYNILAIPLGNLTTIAITPIAPFLVPMKLALLVAFLVALPYSLYQLWSFVAPGLYKHEKRLVYPLLASSVFLFYLGIAFVYFILLPMMFTILPSFAPAGTVVQPDIGFYLDFVIMMSMAFGFGFEMPIATILLISTGMTTAEKLKKKRPYVIVGAFVVGMLLTPPDVVSQIMLAIPMWILFELGIYLSKFFKVRIKEASEAKQARDAASSSAVTGSTTALSADKLWEDDDHTYEEEDGYDDGLSDEERSILNKDPLSDDKNDDEYLPVEEEDFFDNEDYDEPSDEEMEEELDRIEAQEEADKIVKKKAKKRAKKKAKAKKKKAKNKKDDKPTPDEPEEGP
jgi:sec-independent protein translocase protein TatC